MYKLLLVDDEPEIRYGLKHYFPWPTLGFEVVGECDNGRDALSRINKEHIDVLLCDIVMPFMDGLEVAKELHTTKPEIGIILLSAHKDFKYAQSAITYGVKHYIVKPTKYNELVEVFTKLKQDLDHKRNLNKIVDPENIDDQVIHTIKDYVLSNLNEVTLEDVADLVYMSPNYVSKYFKEKTGNNFSTYVIDMRMKKATKLLMDFRYKIYEVSQMVGYQNPNNFTRTFKKYYEMSPREYREGKFGRTI